MIYFETIISNLVLLTDSGSTLDETLTALNETLGYHKTQMLLCDFHIHTNYSDGHHSMTEIVDWYGSSGFQCIAITDHLCGKKSFLGKAAHYLDRTLTKQTYSKYINELQFQSERARHLYGMTVIPGVEITKNSFIHSDSAHILALGINQFLDPDLEIEVLLEQIRDLGGVSVAAHPVSTRKMEAQTYHLWKYRNYYQDKFDCWEVASGPYLFDEVANSGLSLIANSDLHHISQMRAWKTLVRSENQAPAILEAIKKQSIDFIFHKGAQNRNLNSYRNPKKTTSLCQRH